MRQKMPNGFLISHLYTSWFPRNVHICIYISIFYIILQCSTDTCCWNSLSINTLWPSGGIWRHWSRSTLAQIMDYYLTAPSYYRNQCWFLISEILWHSPGNNFTMYAQATILYTFKITATSPRGQWVNWVIQEGPAQYDAVIIKW